MRSGYPYVYGSPPSIKRSKSNGIANDAANNWIVRTLMGRRDTGRSGVVISVVAVF
ncbi:hypothetical protein [Bifidobacterium hapali]|uniref:hypothetical protein n=1 Tax=Bifidobacterium hapali TaxID=1630172 RepID=UPI00130319C1|nr:hypothetical protein [Bifidobacterium hapali]